MSRGTTGPYCNPISVGAQLKLMFEELDEDGSGELTLDEINAAPPDVMKSLFEIAGTEDIPTLFEARRDLFNAFSSFFIT